MHYILFILVFILQQYNIACYVGETVEDTSVKFCQPNEMFSYHLMTCLVCDLKQYLVPSQERDSCICNSNSYIINWIKQFPICQPCPENKMVNSYKTGCISKKKCEVTQIEIDHTYNGTLLDETECITCIPTAHKHDNQCVLNVTHSFNGTYHTNQSEDMYNNIEQWPDISETYKVPYENFPPITSVLLKRNLRKSIYHCLIAKQYKYCEIVANLCVLNLYKEYGACIVFRNHKHIPWANSNDLQLPWLYYGEGDAITVLSRKKITTRYSLRRQSEVNWLNLTAVKYSYSYTNLDMASSNINIINITGMDLQLCYGDQIALNNALRFGTFYKRTCKINLNTLLGQNIDVFELFLNYIDENNKKMIYAVPVLINTNMDNDISTWQLVRRFFVVDTLLGRLDEDSSPSVIRYIRSVVLRIHVQKNLEEEGKIFPPLLVINYGETDNLDESVEVSFSVEYVMNNDDINHFIDVTGVILSCIAIVWSGTQTWSHSRRNDKTTIDLFTLTEMCLVIMGHLSNVFYFMTSSVILYVFIFYKCQDVVYILLPSADQKHVLYTYIIIAFILKIIEIIRMIYKQITVDIFLIDWERPRATGGQHSQPVSIWRTYFIANEWNEIQSKRKTNPLIQILLTVFLLKVVGFENYALAQPELNTNITEEMKYIPINPILKLGVALLTFLLVYLAQWLILIGLYENFIRNGIQQFVDLCSVANVSVFILTLENYGFYIHGRSAHGFADTDMETMATQMLREEEDLVGHRGLLPGTEQQTFEMIIPRQLRSYYKRVIAPLSMNHQNSKVSGSMSAALKMKTLIGSANAVDINRSVQAYNNMNKFLAAFLEHALKDLDYQVKDKLFVEALLDIEFSDTADKGVFYVDNGHSFDNVLFYGVEFTLFTFDIMLFTVLIIWSDNYLYSALMTIFVGKVISYVRDLGGKSNLAKKTLIDERFLI